MVNWKKVFIDINGLKNYYKIFKNSIKPMVYAWIFNSTKEIFDFESTKSYTLNQCATKNFEPSSSWKHYFSIKLILLYCLTMDTKIIFYLSLLLCLHHLLELQPRTICEKSIERATFTSSLPNDIKKVVFMTLWRGFNVLRAVKFSHNEWEWIEFFVIVIKY